MQNPFTPKTQKALTIFGRVIREWSQGQNIPQGATQSGDTIVMARDVFLAHLVDADLSEAATEDDPADFEIRGDIGFVELIIRRPDCFTIVLPEPQAVAKPSPGGVATVELPAIYEEVNPDYASTLDPKAPATRKVDLTSANYEKFLDPYMAGYCCTQCH